MPFLRRESAKVNHMQEERRSKIKEIFTKQGLIIREGFADFSEKLYRATESVLAQLGKGPDWKYLHDHKPPAGGFYLVAVDTDDGPCTRVLYWSNTKKYFIYEGEPTFCQGFMFSPYAWDFVPQPPLVDQEGEDGDA